jgi:(p)ppGpp synthase/HD superfamily hydrolase
VVPEKSQTDPSCAEVARCLDLDRPDRERHAREAAARLADAITDVGLRTEVSVRVKTPCSVREKMDRRGLPLRDLQDVCGVRVLVDTIPDCYTVLQTARTLWSDLPEAFDDYIRFPKENGYRSLHAVVLLPCGHTLELQVRTSEQHREAETGPAAHWRYKLATTAR